jgi:hypothetical protein
MLPPHTKYFVSLIAKIIFMLKLFDLPKKILQLQTRLSYRPIHVTLSLLVRFLNNNSHPYTPPPTYQFCHINNGLKNYDLKMVP